MKPSIRHFGRALAAQLLIGLIVSAIQIVTVFAGLHSVSFSAREAALSLLLGTPFNTGGYTVRFAFQALVQPLEPWFGHRSSTVFSNLPLYALLLALQMTLVAIPVAVRYRRTKTFKDPLMGALAALLLINGLANIMWPWWGT